MKKAIAILLAVIMALQFVRVAQRKKGREKADSAVTEASEGSAKADDAAEVAKDSETFKIGIVLSKTGNDAANGNYCIGGIELAAEEINAAGGINGQQIELILVTIKVRLRVLLQHSI